MILTNKMQIARVTNFYCPLQLTELQMLCSIKIRQAQKKKNTVDYYSPIRKLCNQLKGLGNNYNSIQCKTII